MSVKNKINNINLWLKKNTSIDEKILFIRKFETGQSNPTFLLKSDNKNFVLKSTAIFTLLTWLGGCAAIIYLSNNFSFSESFIKTIFIGLAALTLPHMTLVDFFYRKKFN